MIIMTTMAAMSMDSITRVFLTAVAVIIACNHLPSALTSFDRVKCNTHTHTHTHTYTRARASMTGTPECQNAGIPECRNGTWLSESEEEEEEESTSSSSPASKLTLRISTVTLRMLEILGMLGMLEMPLETMSIRKEVGARTKGSGSGALMDVIRNNRSTADWHVKLVMITFTDHRPSFIYHPLPSYDHLFILSSSLSVLLSLFSRLSLGDDLPPHRANAACGKVTSSSSLFPLSFFLSFSPRWRLSY